MKENILEKTEPMSQYLFMIEVFISNNAQIKKA
jgi:hypothetical protein